MGVRTLWLTLVAVAFGLGPAQAESLRAVIDREISAAWVREGIEPAELSPDAVFLRRVYLDLVGTIPTADEAVAFLDDSDPQKREELISRLLEDPRFAQHQADVWDMVFFGRNPPGYKTNERPGFQRFLRRQFAENVPYHEWARSLLKADGNSIDDGPPMYYLQYDRRPEDAAVAVTKTFLGVQLECARCHDHPYEDYTQLDFYGMAAFFARLRKVEVGKDGKQTKIAIGEKNTGDVMFTGPASDQGPGKKGEPVGPKFMQADVLDEPPLPDGFKDPKDFPKNKMPPKPHFSRKDALAEWITQPENPWFAQAAANRVWAQFMGRGIVHPVDNFSPLNSPSHPELLGALAEGLREHSFDLKWYIGELCNSRTYQLSHRGPVTDPRPQWFERARVRPLSAEELADSWRVATDYNQTDKDALKKLETNRFHPLTSGYALRFFGRPNTGTGDFQGGLHEHLYLNYGQVGSLISTREGGLHHQLLASEEPWESRVERLFLSTLSRRPTSDEQAQFVSYITADKEPRDRLREAIWTLLTCSEFRFNH